MKDYVFLFLQHFPELLRRERTASKVRGLLLSSQTVLNFDERRLLMGIEERPGKSEMAKHIFVWHSTPEGIWNKNLKKFQDPPWRTILQTNDRDLLMLCLPYSTGGFLVSKFFWFLIKFPTKLSISFSTFLVLRSFRLEKKQDLEDHLKWLVRMKNYQIRIRT